MIFISPPKPNTFIFLHNQLQTVELLPRAESQSRLVQFWQNQYSLASFSNPPSAPPLPPLTVVHEYGWQASLARIITVPQVHINHVNIKMIYQ